MALRVERGGRGDEEAGMVRWRLSCVLGIE